MIIGLFRVLFLEINSFLYVHQLVSHNTHISVAVFWILLPFSILIFYFFIIRPQRKRDKQHNNMIAGINRGDQIVTIGGFLGTVREVREDTFQIEIAEGVRVRILKSAVQTKRAAASDTSAAKQEASS